MVARKVLDGLRKGKKDIYALNVQYVRRYMELLSDVQHFHEALDLTSIVRKLHLLTLVSTANS